MSIHLGVSTYSYWHFTKDRVSIEHVLDEAANLGLSGVEILHRQMESEEPAYLNRLKRLAFLKGLDLYALSIHQGSPKKFIIRLSNGFISFQPH